MGCQKEEDKGQIQKEKVQIESSQLLSSSGLEIPPQPIRGSSWGYQHILAKPSPPPVTPCLYFPRQVLISSPLPPTKMSIASTNSLSCSRPNSQEAWSASHSQKPCPGFSQKWRPQWGHQRPRALKQKLKEVCKGKMGTDHGSLSEVQHLPPSQVRKFRMRYEVSQLGKRSGSPTSPSQQRLPWLLIQRRPHSILFSQQHNQVGRNCLSSRPSQHSSSRKVLNKRNSIALDMQASPFPRTSQLPIQHLYTIASGTCQGQRQREPRAMALTKGQAI